LDEQPLSVPSSSMVSVLTIVFSVIALGLMVHLWGDYRAVERLHYTPDGPKKEWARYQRHGPTLLLPYEQLAIALHLNVTPETASLLAKIERQAVQFYPGAESVQRYALALAYLGKTDEAVDQVRRLREEYWYVPGYAAQFKPLEEVCGKNSGDLKAFCIRLRSEKLLVDESIGSGAETEWMRGPK
ncbi:MAG: O-antigen ligase C-terminal domain-containing protein, partial [Burkholderiaceae bacterium]|nr:O-antigen ligase C-terminal domain-containing protein [Burkholderiaceae bacterium]